MRTPSLIAALLLPPLTGDTLTLSDGGKLTANVLELTEDGRLRAHVETAEGIVEFRSDQMLQVLFDLQRHEKSVHDTQVTLINGDVLMCDLLSVTEQDILVTSESTGELRIPRNFVRMAQFAVRPGTLIYSGPQNLSGWKVFDNWRFENESLISDGRGAVSREFKKLPPSFSLSFKLKWKRDPDFTVCFLASVRDPGSVDCRCYYVQLVGSELRLARAKTAKSRITPIARFSVSPLPDNQDEIHIRLQIDQPTGQIGLFVNNQPEGIWEDPSVSHLITGNFITFESNHNHKSGHIVSEIELREWNPKNERFRGEDRGDPTQDALIDAEGQRFSGSILGTDDETRVLNFRSPSGPEPLVVPLNRISTLLFRENAADPAAHGNLIIGLANSGRLTAGSCVFSPTELRLTHPLLGEIQLARTSMVELARRPVDEDQPTAPPIKAQ